MVESWGETGSVKATVWVDGWQMQCCGEPFVVGSRVVWSVTEPDSEWLAVVAGPALAVGVTHAEEHHSDGQRDLDSLEGVVVAIRAVHYRAAPDPYGDPRQLHPVAGSAKIVTVEEATGWDEVEDLSFAGYLVNLGER
ncbi:DUF6578 domain-containing protein [Actinokineospora sp. UTMC 2448]|uniref:DUF6578 domain-containing protein n=1 Tax=Actinokineospora sp. UTMC 2448 TaxID=2268449 RepID=UPI002164E327|nr:DUF6578 domain-containing protein [Actinokineospora sp. UTMC 2448]UVS79509.1 hypothetical protein Actkin_03259 [Actinokineospora sp. UTMC 2448]